MDLIWSRVQELDERITHDEPFKLVKTDPVAGRTLLAELVTGVSQIALDLAPAMPETSKKILSALAENKKPENLFPRLEK